MYTFESEHIPTCSCCNQPVRHNVQMFDDWDWINDRTEEQESHYSKWLSNNRNQNIVIIEMGAGNPVPRVRYESE